MNKPSNKDVSESRSGELKNSFRSYALSVTSKFDAYLFADKQVSAQVTTLIESTNSRARFLLILSSLAASYVFSFIFFGCGRFIKVALKLHQIDLFTFQLALTASMTYGRFGLGGALVCLLVILFCQRIKLNHGASVLISLACSFIVPALCFGAWELPQLLHGRPTDWNYVADYVFRYLPEFPGAGGLFGGLSLLSMSVIIESIRKKFRKDVDTNSTYSSEV